MPTYVYSCSACGTTFERYESITAKPNNQCTKCKRRKGKRNISGGAGFLFKGSGFYTTDYRSSAYKESAKKESTPTPAPAPAPCSTCGDPKGPGACQPPAPAPASGSAKAKSKK